MIGELSSLRVMKQSSIDRVKEYDDVSYIAAKNTNDILAVQIKLGSIGSTDVNFS